MKRPAHSPCPFPYAPLLAGAVCAAVWGAVLVCCARSAAAGWGEADAALSLVLAAAAGAGAVLATARRVVLRASWLDLAAGGWYLYVLTRAWVGDPSYPCAAQCLRATQLAALYAALRLLLPAAGRKAGGIVAAGIVLFSLYEAFAGAGQLGSGRSLHPLYPMTGTFANPGPYAVALAMGLAAACAAWRERQDFPGKVLHEMEKSTAAFPPFLFFLLLPATWSRTALLAAGASLAVTFRRQWLRHAVWLLPLSAVAAAGLLLLKAGSARGRLLMAHTSLQAWGESPLWGSGIGSFFHRYAEATARLSEAASASGFRHAGVLDHGFCTLLRIGVEQGLAGVAFALALAGMTGTVLWRKSPPLFAALLVLLVSSLFSYPLELLPFQAVFAALAACAATAGCPLHGRKAAAGAVPSRWRAVCTALLPLVCAAAGAALTYAPIRDRARAGADFRLLAGLPGEAFLRETEELLPLLDDDPHYLFALGKALASAGRPNDSNAALRRGTRVSNDPMFYTLQGHNYLSLGALREAETAYRKAFHILPNRLYPLYQLMLLYETTGETGKMRRMAQCILRFKVKVPSPATKEMQQEARRRLREKK